MLLLEPQMATRKGTIEAIAGNDQIRRSGLIVLAALWHDELAHRFCGRVKSWMFADELLRTIAAFSVGNVSVFGLCDEATIERLLRDRFPDRASAVTVATILRLVELIEADDVDNALAILTEGRRALAC